MARIHGRKGRVYLGVADSSAVATPLPFIANWTLNFATDREEVTAMEDDNKVYVSGLPDASGSFEGFYDDASAQTYTAAVDGLPRKFYLYPDRTNSAVYFFGTILADMQVNGGVGGAVQISADWNAASTITKVG